MASTKCAFCNITDCPFVVPEQCPVKALADRVETMSRRIKEVNNNLTVVVESLSAN